MKIRNDYRRAIHVDFHTMAGIYDMNDFDAKQFARLMAEAHVTYVNVFAQCNLGFCYYPTKVGVMYPSLTKDMLGELVEELHKYDIGVTAYINSGFNNEILKGHPDWWRRAKNGNRHDPTVIDGKEYYRRYEGCFNTGYADYLKAIVKEVVDNYDVDGIFMDCVPLTHCYCENCRKDMAEKGISIDDEPNVYKFAEEVRVNWARELRKVVGDRNIYFNSWYTWDLGLNEHHELECLPNGAWTYEYFDAHAAFTRPLKEKALYMTGRFQNDWGDFGGICSKASLEHDMFDALMSGFGYSIGDHAHPSKTLIPRLYKTIKEIYTDLKQYQKFNDNAKYKADVGIYISSKLIRKYDMWMNKYLGHLLGDLKYTYNAILNLESINDYPLIIIPENITLDEEDTKIFDNYIKNGGKVFSCGMGGLNSGKTEFAIEEVKNTVKYCGKDDRYQTFFEFNDGVSEEYGEVQWNTYKPAIMMEKVSGTVIAEDVKAYFDKEFDGEKFNLYIPPEKKTGYPTAVIGKNVAHVSFDLFRAYGNQFSSAHRELTRVILEALLPNNLIKAKELPVTTKASVTENDKYLMLNIKTTYPGIKGALVDPAKGVITDHVYLPAGKKVMVKGTGFKKCFSALTEKPIEFTAKGDYTEITLPEICGFIMVVLEK